MVMVALAWLQLCLGLGLLRSLLDTDITPFGTCALKYYFPLPGLLSYCKAFSGSCLIVFFYTLHFCAENPVQAGYIQLGGNLQVPSPVVPSCSTGTSWNSHVSLLS